MNCKNCRYWIRLREDKIEITKELYYGYGECLCLKMQSERLPKLPVSCITPDLVFHFCPREVVTSRMTTGPDFGCIHFKEKGKCGNENL